MNAYENNHYEDMNVDTQGIPLYYNNNYYNDNNFDVNSEVSSILSANDEFDQQFSEDFEKLNSWNPIPPQSHNNFLKRQDQFVIEKEENLKQLKKDLASKEEHYSFKPKINKLSNEIERRSVEDIEYWDRQKELTLKQKRKVKEEHEKLFIYNNHQPQINDTSRRLAERSIHSESVVERLSKPKDSKTRRSNEQTEPKINEERKQQAMLHAHKLYELGKERVSQPSDLQSRNQTHYHYTSKELEYDRVRRKKEAHERLFNDSKRRIQKQKRREEHQMKKTKKLSEKSKMNIKSQQLLKRDRLYGLTNNFNDKDVAERLYSLSKRKKVKKIPMREEPPKLMPSIDEYSREKDRSLGLPQGPIERANYLYEQGKKRALDKQRKRWEKEKEEKEEAIRIANQSHITAESQEILENSFAKTSVSFVERQENWLKNHDRNLVNLQKKSELDDQYPFTPKINDFSKALQKRTPAYSVTSENSDMRLNDDEYWGWDDPTGNIEKSNDYWKEEKDEVDIDIEDNDKVEPEVKSVRSKFAEINSFHTPPRRTTTLRSVKRSFDKPKPNLIHSAILSAKPMNERVEKANIPVLSHKSKNQEQPTKSLRIYEFDNSSDSDIELESKDQQINIDMLDDEQEISTLIQAEYDDEIIIENESDKEGLEASFQDNSFRQRVVSVLKQQENSSPLAKHLWFEQIKKNIKIKTNNC
eukprot:TRINITY_DN2152_c0_g1_i1.p1 TRINITY_DN2152_c0_g1~~TRINITY_DN2152_c0_g1_i1.p1  ORF type:complete len:699 (+),score=195.33 TRINITY_DN2152_c0_g1_i1:81-2177(+)